MGAFFDSIPDNLLAWIQQQHIFWVATAPLTPNGHVNVSPKGMYDCFHVVNANRVWYEDLTGSGIETISHLRENGRITVMFCAFDGPPRIVRLFGKGSVHEYGTPEYEKFIPPETRKPGSRAAIVIDIYQVGSSCGYTVPHYAFLSNRTILLENMTRREEEERDAEMGKPERGLRKYWVEQNTKSLDGLPGLCGAMYAARPSSTWVKGGKAQMNGDAGRGEPTATKGVANVGRWREDVKLAMVFSLGMLVSAMAARVGRT